MHIWVEIHDQDGLQEHYTHGPEEFNQILNAIFEVAAQDEVDPVWRVEFGPAYDEEEMISLGLMDPPAPSTWEIVDS